MFNLIFGCCWDWSWDSILSNWWWVFEIHVESIRIIYLIAEEKYFDCIKDRIEKIKMDVKFFYSNALSELIIRVEIEMQYFKVDLSGNHWQSFWNAYNHHSLVRYTIFVPLTDHWKLSSSLQSETQAWWFWSLTSRCRKTMTSVFSSVKTLTGQSGASKIRPLCYPNFNNWTVIGSNNSVDPVKNP